MGTASWRSIPIIEVKTLKRFIFELATEKDNTNLLEIMEDNPIHGWIKLVYRRRPSFFEGLDVQGGFNQVVASRDMQTGKIVGFGTRSIKAAYINGSVRNIGYLSNLRLNKEYRHGRLLAEGFRYFKALHQDKKVSMYLTTIIEENIPAKRVLTSKKAGLPAYNNFGLFHTNAIKLSRKKKKIGNSLKIEKGSLDRIEDIVDCLNRNAHRKQFYPLYACEDFISEDRKFRDLSAEDFYVVFRNSKIAGVMAKWDQRSFKQTVVNGYTQQIKILRPIYNFFARISNHIPLPEAGTVLPFFYAGFIAIDHDDVYIFNELLKRMVNEWSGTEYVYCLIGLHERDPFLPIVRQYRHITYLSRLYIVCWEDGERDLRNLDKRVPYLELATL